MNAARNTARNLASLWEFVRRDPVGRWLGIAWVIIAWFAFAWLSLLVALVLVLMTGILVATERKRRDLVLDDDLDDLI